jgi:protein involved in polysaccharide export with SLBB domain
MCNVSLKKIFLFSFVFSISIIGNVSAQTPEETPKKINFGYSRNPKTKVKLETKESQANTELKTAEIQSVNSNQQTKNQENPENIVPESKIEKEQPESTEFESRSVASKTLDVAKRANKAAISPTEIYKVGIADILFISLQNAPSGSTTYFTVLKDGTIDYPLAGKNVLVQGLTTDEIEEYLKENIKVVENPQITVRIREHSSHSITVLGLVEKPGEKFLQREAIPLFVVRAEAIVKTNANRVIIRRANSVTETFDLNLVNYEDVLVFPGDIVEFSNYVEPKPAIQVPQFYYIGGVKVDGQKDYYKGITLTQAILASGGLIKIKFKSVVIRRKNKEGLLVPTEFNLTDIKDGKIPDPLIEAGDTIEVEY